MKILIISDIHGITTNLNHIKTIFESKKCDQLIVLGDLYHCYVSHSDCNISFVKSFLESFPCLICLRGNNDHISDVENSKFPILSGFFKMEVDGICLYFTHGHQYHMDYHPTIHSGVLIYGHDHVPMIQTKNNMIYINAGSVSLPRKASFSTYVFYENHTFTIYNMKDEAIYSITV